MAPVCPRFSSHGSFGGKGVGVEWIGFVDRCAQREGDSGGTK